MKDSDLDELIYLREGLKVGLFNNEQIVTFADNSLLELEGTSEFLIDLALSKSIQESINIIETTTNEQSAKPEIGIQLFNYALKLTEHKILSARELVEKGIQIARSTNMGNNVITKLVDLELNLFQAEDGIVPSKLKLFEQEIFNYFQNIIKTHANNGEHP
jgi:hypothetical protein